MRYLVCDNYFVDDTESILTKFYQVNNSVSEPETKYVYVPPRPLSPRFTGQEMYLEKLRKYFGPHTSTTWQKQRRCFLLHGMGGIGKTQLALKFAEECADR